MPRFTDLRQTLRSNTLLQTCTGIHTQHANTDRNTNITNRKRGKEMREGGRQRWTITEREKYRERREMFV